jgi:hypothetical protein
MAKSDIIHVGYIIAFTQESKKLIETFIGDSVNHLENSAYYCTLFRKTQNEMSGWHNRLKDKEEIIGILKGLFVHKTIHKKRVEMIIIGYICIDGQQLYATLYNNSYVDPINVRKHACAGKYGNMVEIEPSIKLSCNAHITYA